MNRHRVSDSRFVNTSEAYSKHIFIGKTNAVIPYINIGLMPNNPINGSQCVIDFSYYLLTEVSIMDFEMSKDSFVLDFSNNVPSVLIKEYLFAGGYGDKKGAQVLVKCNDLFLFIFDEAKASSPMNPFVPFNTPVFSQNISEEAVVSFFHPRNIPEELKEILGGNFHVLEM